MAYGLQQSFHYDDLAMPPQDPLCFRGQGRLLTGKILNLAFELEDTRV